MTKFKIQAGAEIDIPSHKEVKDIVDRSNESAWHQYTVGRLLRMSTVAGFTLQNALFQPLDGPEAGFTWSVRRLTLNIPNAVTFELHFNDGQPSTYIGDVVRGSNQFTSRSVVVKGGSVLGLYIPTGGPVNVAGATIAFEEVPTDQEYKL